MTVDVVSEGDNTQWASNTTVVIKSMLLYVLTENRLVATQKHKRVVVDHDAGNGIVARFPFTCEKNLTQKMYYCFVFFCTGS